MKPWVKPCICGRKPTLTFDPSKTGFEYVRVVCACGRMGETFSNNEKAVEDWNIRTIKEGITMIVSNPEKIENGVWVDKKEGEE